MTATTRPACDDGQRLQGKACSFGTVYWRREVLVQNVAATFFTAVTLAIDPLISLGTDQKMKIRGLQNETTNPPWMECFHLDEMQPAERNACYSYF